MVQKRLKIIRLPCELKTKVKRLARLNGLTSSELIRLSIEIKLPYYETSQPHLSKVDDKQVDR